MIKSKPTISFLLLPILVIVMTFVIFWMGVSLNDFSKDKEDIGLENIMVLITALILSAVWVGLFYRHFQTNLVSVEIEGDYLTYKKFVGNTEQYHFKDFEGYYVSFLTSESGTFETLYLLRDNKKIVKLSAFYHRNFDELKREISKRAKLSDNSCI